MNSLFETLSDITCNGKKFNAIRVEKRGKNFEVELHFANSAICAGGWSKTSVDEAITDAFRSGREYGFTYATKGLPAKFLIE